MDIRNKHLFPLNREQEITKNWLVENDFRKPTEQDFPTYLMGKLNKLPGPYLEDVYFAWKNDFFNFKLYRCQKKYSK